MSGTFFYLALVACLVTLAVLAFGVITFARGGAFNRKYSNKLMRLRIVAQAVAVVLILIAVLLAQGGG